MGSTTHDLQKRGSATPTYKFLSNIARCQKNGLPLHARRIEKIDPVSQNLINSLLGQMQTRHKI